MTKQSEAMAYSISRMPSTYCAVYSALSQVIKNYEKELKKTIKEEVIKYIELLKIYKQNIQKLSDKKAETIIQKQLIKKK